MNGALILLAISSILATIGYFGKSLLDSRKEKIKEDLRKIEEMRRIEEQRNYDERIRTIQRDEEQKQKRRDFLSVQIMDKENLKELRLKAYEEYVALGGNGYITDYVEKFLLTGLE